MALEINHPEVDKLVRELAAFTGESTPQIVLNSLRERLERMNVKRRHRESVKGKLLRISRECAALPILDARTPDEVLDYDSIDTKPL